MDAVELLLTRYSALKLGEPAPSAQAVQAMLESAARAPDHGRLQPWRLILIEGRHASASAGSWPRRCLGGTPLPANRPSPASERKHCVHLSSLWSQPDAIGLQRSRSSSRLSPPAVRHTASCWPRLPRAWGRCGEPATPPTTTR